MNAVFARNQMESPRLALTKMNVFDTSISLAPLKLEHLKRQRRIKFQRINFSVQNMPKKLKEKLRNLETNWCRNNFIATNDVGHTKM